MRRWIPHLVQVATVSAVIGICIWVAYQRHLPPAPLTRKIAEAERLSYQVVTRAQGPRFEIRGNERLIKIVSHAVLDPNLEYDPRRAVSYGFRLRIMDEGRSLWQHDALLESRQSKDARLSDLWMHENAFTSRLDTELSDDRMLLVHMPEDVVPGSMLELTLLGEPEEALVRVYKYAERSEGALRRALHRVDEAGGRPVFTRNTFTPWSLLAEDDKLDRLSHNFERLAPVGEAGMDFYSRSVFYTGFRSAPEEMESDQGLVLERHRGLVLNVLGPTSLRVELRRASTGTSESIEEAGHPGPGEVVRIRSVAEGAAGHQRPDDASPSWELAVPSSRRPEIHSIEIPAGLHSLHFFTDARAPVRLDVSGPPMSQFGAIPYVRHDEVDRRLLPDERRLVVYETGPDKLPAMAGIFVPGDSRARILRVDVRIEVAPDPPGVADVPPLSSSRFKAGVVFEYLDAQERVLAAEQQAIEAPYTPFERMERSDGSVISLSDSVGLRLIAPADTHWVRLTASRDVAIRFYRYLDGEDEYQAPYDQAPLARSVWRYAPRDRRQWFYSAPSNATSLVEADQRSLLIAQVRLQPVGLAFSGQMSSDASEQVSDPGHEAVPDGPRRGGGAPAIAVAPLGRPEQHVIFEPIPPRRFTELLLRWPVGVATRLSTGQPTRFRFDGGTRPRLDYRIPSEHLGKTLTVRVDGEPLVTMRFTTTRGYWSLPRVNPGNHAFEVETEARGAELYLDRPPAPAAAGGPARFELIRRRTVYALGPEPLELAVRKPPGKRVLVTMVVYAPWPELRDDVELRMVIGGGVPQRVTRMPFSRITVADRTLPLPEASSSIPVTFADRHGSPAGYPRAVTVPLGEDLVTGGHRIGFSVSGVGRLWVRFYVTHQAPAQAERALQWYLHEDDAPFSGPAPAEEPEEPASRPAE